MTQQEAKERFIGSLSKFERHVLVLHGYEKLNTAEIARVLGRPRWEVEERLGLLRLRAMDMLVEALT